MIPVEHFDLLKTASATGEGASMPISSGEALVVAVSGTFTATIKAQGYLGGEWNDVCVVKLSDGSSAESISASGAYAIPCAYGFEAIRLNVTAYTSGEISATAKLCRTN
ncbi:MAG: hypothetical protein J6S14_22055 [Clostridia bacterium]|nr:hypothetical protein [Clostridia bacterium]